MIRKWQNERNESMTNTVTPEQIKEILDTRISLVHRFEVEPQKLVRTEAWLDNTYLLADAVSKAVDPENFDTDLGIKYSTENALKAAESALWNVEGYKLYDSLRKENGSTFLTRLQDEYAEVRIRTAKLETFLQKGRPDNISEDDWSDLQEQHFHQSNYEKVLAKRLQKLNKPF